MKTGAVVLAAVLTLTGCSKRLEAPSASIPEAKAKQAATAVALLTNGKVCAVAPTRSMVPMFDSNAYLVTETAKCSDIRLGDIVVRTDGEGGKWIVHRVVAIDGGRLVTKGDGNDSNDPGFVDDAKLQSRVVAIVFSTR